MDFTVVGLPQVHGREVWVNRTWHELAHMLSSRSGPVPGAALSAPLLTARTPSVPSTCMTDCPKSSLDKC